ncbi:MAG: type II toxin-antitoxin system HicA family toxin [Pseudomonadota bacterium]|nr:type II toxin-antitoxin system HicA family toxin [Pseudomonadota bacterium]
MSSQHPPLTCKQVKTILKNLGFAARPQNGTSHEQWVREDSRGFFKVTVDCPKQPFTGDLVKWMAAQAGLSKKAFYKALTAKPPTLPLAKIESVDAIEQ